MNVTDVLAGLGGLLIVGAFLLVSAVVTTFASRADAMSLAASVED